MKKGTIFSIGIFAFSMLLALGAAEIALRVKNSSMENYDIEMWRYARELKSPSGNTKLGHEHIPNQESILQSVSIRINEHGMRGGPVQQKPEQKRRVLFLGASITLGWGVPENETVTARLEQMMREAGDDVEVLNAGIGNYNAERYIELFFTKLKTLEPTDIVVHYFLRDAEKLERGGGNFFLRNSQLAVTLWIAANRLLGASGEHTLKDHYAQVYDEDQPGYKSMRASLDKLSAYAKANGINVYLAMVPDVHNLENYSFEFIHDHMKDVSNQLDFTYIDLLKPFESLKPEDVWAMPGDPHPNGFGHRLMAETLFPVLSHRVVTNSIQ